MTEALVIAVTGCVVAFINILPQFKMRKDVKRVSDKVDDLSDYIKNDKDADEVRNKMLAIQSYYVDQMDLELQPVAVMKADAFIDLIVNFGMGLDLDDLNDYKKFRDHLYTSSKYCKIRMAQLLGEELTTKYYIIHDNNTIRFDKIIQKLFFTTENSKKTKFISASVDFLQLFLIEIVCLRNGRTKKLLDEESQHLRRCEDHK